MVKFSNVETVLEDCLRSSNPIGHHGIVCVLSRAIDDKSTMRLCVAYHCSHPDHFISATLRKIMYKNVLNHCFLLPSLLSFSHIFVNTPPILKSWLHQHVLTTLQESKQIKSFKNGGLEWPGSGVLTKVTWIVIPLHLPSTKLTMKHKESGRGSGDPSNSMRESGN